MLFIIEITWTVQIKSVIQNQQTYGSGTREWTLCTKGHKYYMLEMTLRYWELSSSLNYWAVLENYHIYVSYTEEHGCWNQKVMCKNFSFDPGRP